MVEGHYCTMLYVLSVTFICIWLLLFFSAARQTWMSLELRFSAHQKLQHTHTANFKRVSPFVFHTSCRIKRSCWVCALFPWSWTNPTMKAKQSKCENEQGTQIYVEIGISSLEEIHSCSINSSLIQFKVIHRLHYSKTKLQRYKPRSLQCLINVAWRRQTYFTASLFVPRWKITGLNFLKHWLK